MTPPEYISPNELQRLFPGASASTLARNGVGALPQPIAQPAAVPEPRRTDASKARRPRGLGRSAGPVLVVTLTRHGHRLLDSDNLAGGMKHLRDAIAASLGLDDGDERLRWCYGQVQTDGSEGVLVLVEVVR